MITRAVGRNIGRADVVEAGEVVEFDGPFGCGLADQRCGQCEGEGVAGERRGHAMKSIM